MHLTALNALECSTGQSSKLLTSMMTDLPISREIMICSHLHDTKLSWHDSHDVCKHVKGEQKSLQCMTTQTRVPTPFFKVKFKHF